MAFEGPQTNTTTVDRVVVSLDDGTLPKQEFERYLERLRAFQKRIGYEFNDEALLIRALTSRSYRYCSKDKASDKGQMEIKGDQLLGRGVKWWVDKQIKDKVIDPSAETRYFLDDFLRSNVYLSLVGFRIGIADCIRFSREKLQSEKGAEKQIRMLANFVESLIDSIYEDGGREALELFVDRHVLPYPKEGTVTHIIPDLFSKNLRSQVMAFTTYTHGKANLVIRRGNRDYRGYVYLKDKRLSQPIYVSKYTQTPRQAAAKTIISFSKSHPWVVWGSEGPTSLIFPTVIDNNT